MPSHVIALLQPKIAAVSTTAALILAGGTLALTHALTPSPGIQLKGVGTWKFAGVNRALAESGASWYYNWGPGPDGMSVPRRMSFVPMVWGPSHVTAATLGQVRREGRVLLGFNEPDLSTQSDMTVRQALGLWPRLMATGMELGSPAVASDAATPGSWLDQFMSGAKARGYRVDFIAVHWYGADYRTGPAVQQLRAYLQAVYVRYHRPIWITEFALANFESPTPSFPTRGQQTAFLKAATAMVAGLSYVQRYAWFALPTAPDTGTTGLFNADTVLTEVGHAFKAAPA